MKVIENNDKKVTSRTFIHGHHVHIRGKMRVRKKLSRKKVFNVVCELLNLELTST